MPALAKFLHLAAALFWVGGMGFVLLALRPVVHAQLAPPVRLALMAAVLRRFFAVVWLGIALLLLTGMHMLVSVGMRSAPLGWHYMLGLGLLMMAVFAHLYFVPYRRLQRAVAAADWPLAGRHMASITLLVKINFALAWFAIAAVILIK